MYLSCSYEVLMMQDFIAYNELYPCCIYLCNIAYDFIRILYSMQVEISASCMIAVQKLLHILNLILLHLSF
jgi:hypothetical protein